jgi:hypothetical protein
LLEIRQQLAPSCLITSEQIVLSTFRQTRGQPGRIALLSFSPNLVPARLIMPDETWPPSFTLDQERILKLLTGDRFYSNPSAALREAVLNAIDGVHRRRSFTPNLEPDIKVIFNRADTSVTISDNGIGMNRDDVNALFTKVGASAATAESGNKSVGEFGIGVVSYFMAADTFELHTLDGSSQPIGLLFSKDMLAGGDATDIPSIRNSRGTTVRLATRDAATFDLLLDKFGYWCRHVDGLSASVLPDGGTVGQGGLHRARDPINLPTPNWVERSHLSPVADPTGWEGMTGVSTVAVLYRGVFVQEFEVKGAWGIEGSIDVDPKHFKPRLNREGFVEGQFQAEVEAFLRQCHPAVLQAMAGRLSEAMTSGALDKWTQKRWATLWLSVPRSGPYAAAVAAWDAVFREIPAFELAVGNKWQAVSLEHIKELHGEIFVAPLADDKSTDVVSAALHLLRNTGRHVIRGIRKDNSWMRLAPGSYGTTAELISRVFAEELPRLVAITAEAEQLLDGVNRSAPLFTGPPPVDLVRLGPDSAPALRLKRRLVINTDNAKGADIVRDVLRENQGPTSLVSATVRHAHEQLTEVAAAVRQISGEPEILSPMRRRFIQGHLS